MSSHAGGASHEKPFTQSAVGIRSKNGKLMTLIVQSEAATWQPRASFDCRRDKQPPAFGCHTRVCVRVSTDFSLSLSVYPHTHTHTHSWYTAAAWQSRHVAGAVCRQQTHLHKRDARRCSLTSTVDARRKGFAVNGSTDPEPNQILISLSPPQGQDIAFSSRCAFNLVRAKPQDGERMFNRQEDSCPHEWLQPHAPLTTGTSRESRRSSSSTSLRISSAIALCVRRSSLSCDFCRMRFRSQSTLRDKLLKSCGTRR